MNKTIENFFRKNFKFFLALPQKIKTTIFVILILIIVVAAGLLWQTKGVKSDNKNSRGNQIAEEKFLFSGKPIAVFQVGETARLGSLEISFYNVKESSYQSFELDKNYQRITKKYLAAQIKVFNLNNDKTENLAIGLVDNLGNKYLPDNSVSSYVPDLKEFGSNMNIYPRIIQEGYIYFSDVNEKTNELQLVFAIKSSKERIVFKFTR